MRDKLLLLLIAVCTLWLALFILFVSNPLNNPSFNSRANGFAIVDAKNLKSTVLPQEVIVKNISPYTEKDKNRDRIFMNSDEAIISDTPLPPKVHDAQKNKVGVELRLYLRSHSNPLISMGTGFVYAPGYIVTARHILMETITQGVRFGLPYQIGLNGIPEGRDFTYEFSAEIADGKSGIKFAVSLVAMGEMGTFRDMMVLKVNDNTMEIARKLAINQNPYAAILSTTSFNTDAHLTEKVFMSGMHDMNSFYTNKRGIEDAVLSAKRNYTFQGEVVQRIEHLPINRLGIKRFYEIRGDAEPGFSGGPAFNSDGEVVGMTIEKTEKFIYLVSSSDILDFLRENKFIKN